MMKRLVLLAPLMLASCVIYDRPSGWVPARVPLTPNALIEMKLKARSESAIWSELEFHGLAWKLSADDLVALKKAGASDNLLAAVLEAPVTKPEEAKPIYSRHSHAGCAHCSVAVPVYFATALSLNYALSWGCHK